MMSSTAEEAELGARGRGPRAGRGGGRLRRGWAVGRGEVGQARRPALPNPEPRLHLVKLQSQRGEGRQNPEPKLQRGAPGLGW